MHGAGLEHGAARRLEEAEPLAERLPCRLPPALVAAAHPLDEGQRLAHLVDVDAGVERAQPVGVDGPGDVEEVRALAVQHHADVDELLALGPRHAAQHDVLVGEPGGAHGAAPGSHWRVPRRAVRKSTYAARSAAGVSAPGHRLEPDVGHVLQDLGEDLAPQRAAISSSSSRARRAHVSITCPLASQGWAANRAGSVTPARQPWWK